MIIVLLFSSLKAILLYVLFIIVHIDKINYSLCIFFLVIHY